MIRVAGNVLDRYQLGTIEYALSHLGCKEIIVLGHTGCGAVGAALPSGGEGFIRPIIDDIREAIGEEKTPSRPAVSMPSTRPRRSAWPSRTTRRWGMWT